MTLPELDYIEDANLSSPVPGHVMALAALAVLHQETLPALDVAAGVDHESVRGGAGDLATTWTRPRHDTRHPGVTITHWLS